MMVAALKDTAAFMKNNTAEADKIANETVKLPPGILTAAINSKRFNMIIEPAWEPKTRKDLTDILERPVKPGFYDKIPGNKNIYSPEMQILMVRSAAVWPRVSNHEAKVLKDGGLIRRDARWAGSSG